MPQATLQTDSAGWVVTASQALSAKSPQKISFCENDMHFDSLRLRNIFSRRRGPAPGRCCRRRPARSDPGHRGDGRGHQLAKVEHPELPPDRRLGVCGALGKRTGRGHDHRGGGACERVHQPPCERDQPKGGGGARFAAAAGEQHRHPTSSEGNDPFSGVLGSVMRVLDAEDKKRVIGCRLRKGMH